MFPKARLRVLILGFAACMAWFATVQASTVAPPLEVTIDFETDASGTPLTAPALFSNPYKKGDPGALPLTDLYAPLGVVWAGNGAILIYTR